MKRTIIEYPVTEHLSVSDAKTHLRIVGTDDDAYITALIKVAREWAEKWTCYDFTVKKVEYSFDCFSSQWIEVPGNVRNLESIKYIDTQGNEINLSGARYGVDIRGLYCYVWPKDSWPVTMAQPNAVRITVNVGYQSDIPAAYIHALKLLVAHFYESRVPLSTVAMVEPEFAVKSLLAPFDLSGSL